MSGRLNCNSLRLRFLKDCICLERSEKLDVTLWIRTIDKEKSKAVFLKKKLHELSVEVGESRGLWGAVSKAG